jgi:serpin B
MEKEARRPSKKARGTSGDSTSGLAALALRLSNKLAACEEHEGKNIMFSPLSIYTALGLVAAGAQGTTLDEVLAVLGAVSRDEVAGVVRAVAEGALAAADEDPSRPLVVTTACGVWCQKDWSLKPAYRQAVVESYKAEVRALDFVRKVSSSI